MALVCESMNEVKPQAGKGAIFAFLLLSIFVSLGAAEIMLRVAGFSYRLYPEKIEFGWPRPNVMKDMYMPDDLLLWVQKDYQQKLQRLRQSPPGIILMGDSCTEFGKYDEYLSQNIQRDYPDSALSVAKLGVGGWTSYQGLQQLKRDISPLKPEIVTIYYGWNDHWIGFGIQDKEIGRIRSPLFSRLERLRITQLAVKTWIILTQKEKNSFPYRVTLDDFRTNLSEMVRAARKAGIIPVLLTAPSSHRRGKEPQYLQQRHIKNLQELIPLHQSYAAVVREVASTEKAPLCDLFADFDALPGREVSREYFNKDGIHLTQRGSEKLAEFLYACLKGQNLLVPEGKNERAVQ